MKTHEMNEKYTDEELTSIFEYIRLGFENIHALFKENMGVVEDDEDMLGLQETIDELEE